MAAGGSRPGAGRKRTRDKNAGAVIKAEKQIRDKLPELVEGLVKLALGVTVQETDQDTGGLTVYTKPPDFKAGSYLVNRIMGTPVQRTKDEDSDQKLSAYGQLIHELRASRGLSPLDADDDDATD